MTREKSENLRGSDPGKQNKARTREEGMEDFSTPPKAPKAPLPEVVELLVRVAVLVQGKFDSIA